MRSRDSGSKRPCELCKTPTVFVFDVKTPRGRHVRFADVCVPCGEQPALTKNLPTEAPKQKGKAAA